MNAGPILVINAEVLTFGDPCGVIHKGTVLVEDGIIAAVGQSPESPVNPSDVRVIDAGGRVVTPGLVNSHMHLYSTFACGLAPEPSHNFPEILETLWWRLDRALTLEDVRLSALVPAIRSLRSGVTTLVDHHASYGAVAGSLATIADAVRDLGLRACLCFEVSDRQGESAVEESIAENAAFLASLATRDDPDLSGLFGLHASFTLSDETLTRCVDAAAGTGFHVHCAEDKADLADAKARGSTGVVDRLNDFGILGDGSIAAHCIHVSNEEIQRLARNGTWVVTNPQSNMNNGVGTAPIARLLEAGCRVALGSDGMTADILEEARALFLSNRQKAGVPDILFAEAAYMITETNPRIASSLFGRPVGILEEGAAGDVVLWDYVPPTPLEEDNVAGHLLFGLPSSRPRTVISSGRVLVDDFELPGVDEAAIAAEARSQARSLWKRW